MILIKNVLLGNRCFVCFVKYQVQNRHQGIRQINFDLLGKIKQNSLRFSKSKPQFFLNFHFKIVSNFSLILSVVDVSVYYLNQFFYKAIGILNLCDVKFFNIHGQGSIFGEVRVDPYFNDSQLVDCNHRLLYDEITEYSEQVLKSS